MYIYLMNINKNIKKKNISDNKGNWEFSFFQKKYDPNNEGNIKLSINPDKNFDPKLIHQYINSTLSKEEIILNKKKNNESLNTSEMIILHNYLHKESETIKIDINNIKKYGLATKPLTKEGKTRLLLHTLDYQIKKDNKDLIANIYLRLLEDQFEITPNIQEDYKEQIEYMNKVINEIDLIELQFTKLYSQMPPLNNQGFKKLDNWQINVINNIDNNISTLINAPTSAGKSILSGYTVTKGRVLFVVPTDALAWQMSAYIGNILNTNIPIITATYQTCPNRDMFIELLNLAPAITGTAETIIDYLPFIKCDFKWIIFDEIHMIGNPEGNAMEYILKLLSNIPFLALSATISNIDDVIKWFSEIQENRYVDKIICTKRFFNLQRYYYDSKNDQITNIHPLALIDEDQIKNKQLLLISLQPTPPDIWNLAITLKNKFDLNDLCPYKYFSPKRIELNDTYEYFNNLLKFIQDTYDTDKNNIMEIINNYKKEYIISSDVNLINLAFKLKNENKTPAIFFQKNTIICLKMIRKFAKNLEELELQKYPKLFSDRLKQEKLSKRLDKKKNDENDNKDKDKSKKLLKQMMTEDINKVEIINENNSSLQEPHIDFILNNNQYFHEGIVEDWVEKLKYYFPNNGYEYHFIIKLLWRGVGVYTEGLPDPYLRLVQTLACQKQLAIVFSDKSLIFGISMPFRSVVIINDTTINDDLDSMLFQQMCGRAGRRGLDKEGNIIFAGYSWNRIKELLTSKSPIIISNKKVIYTIPHANQLSILYNTQQNWNKIYKHFLNPLIDENELNELLNNIQANYYNNWSFSYINNNINHLHMNWKLRHNNDCIIASFLLPYLKREFEDKDYSQEINQINLAHFLCNFFSIIQTNEISNSLEKYYILNTEPYNQIIDKLKLINIYIPENIDNKLFISIQNNSININTSETFVDKLRTRLIDFGEKIKSIQHYYYHSKITGLSKLFGKLLTRIWWIYHTSSPIMKSLYEYDNINNN